MELVSRLEREIERRSLLISTDDASQPECLLPYDAEESVLTLSELVCMTTNTNQILIRQTLLWLLFATRPLTLSELKEILDFYIAVYQIELQATEVESLVDLTGYLSSLLKGVARIEVSSATVPVITFDGKHIWSTKQCEHAVFKDDRVVACLEAQPLTSWLFFEPRKSQIQLAELCLMYLSTVSGVSVMSEYERVEACAEFPFLQYALNSLSFHLSHAATPDLRTLLASEILQDANARAIIGTLLPAACRRNDHAMVHILAECVDANAREQGPDSHTALIYAAISGNLAIVDLLLSQPDIQVDLRGRGGMTALHFAMQEEHLSLARLLMSKGHANVEVKDSHGWAAIDFLFRTTGAKAGYKLEEHFQQTIQTIDQIVLSSHDKMRELIPEASLQVARQNGHGQTVAYLMQRYMSDPAAHDSHAKNSGGR